MKLSNKKLVNPFIYQGYESPEYFCDRENVLKTCGMCLKKIDSARLKHIFIDIASATVIEFHTRRILLSFGNTFFICNFYRKK